VSTLLTRIMLAIFMLPAAAMVYFGVIVLAFELLPYGVVYTARKIMPFVIAGAAAWLFIAGYWLLLWRTGIAWTDQRKTRTLLAAGASLVIGLSAGCALHLVEDEVGAFFGSAITPITWLILTTLVWRETTEERAQRDAGGAGVACPSCGYNLTGLRGTRCPECGVEFTLDSLMAIKHRETSAELV
jgi:hypothetical protein